MPNVIQACSLDGGQGVLVRAPRALCRGAYKQALHGLLLIGVLGASVKCQAAAGPDLADLVGRAKAAQAAGETRLARALLDPALRSPKITPTDRAALYLMRAQLFIDEGAPVSARLDAERATDYDPTNGDALSLRARLNKDPSASAKLYLKAARQGVTEAQREAGARLMSGLGVPADHRKARYWLQQAANAGDSPAMLLLARSYREAVDPAQRNLVLAASWQQRAAAAALTPATSIEDEVRAPSAPTRTPGPEVSATNAATATSPSNPTLLAPVATSTTQSSGVLSPAGYAPANAARNQVRSEPARVGGPRAAQRGLHTSTDTAATVRNRSSDLRAESPHN